jgi:hypothetical protein
MKKIEISMDRGVIEASTDKGTVGSYAFLGRLEINMKAHGDLMPEHQIRAFLTSVVLPQLDLFSRQLETEAIEEEEIALETKAGPAP